MEWCRFYLTLRVESLKINIVKAPKQSDTFSRAICDISGPIKVYCGFLLFIIMF